MSLDLYDILGVPANASQEAIDAAYLCLSRTAHPDRFSQYDEPDEWKRANEKFKELNRARDVLGDPKSRAEYDLSRTKAASPSRSYSKAPPAKETNHYSSNAASTATSSEFWRFDDLRAADWHNLRDIRAKWARYSGIRGFVEVCKKDGRVFHFCGVHRRDFNALLSSSDAERHMVTAMAEFRTRGTI